MNVVTVLNRHLACPTCHSNDGWSLVSRPNPRQNSTINALQCSRCKERIAAKMPHENDAGGGSRRLVQREFQTLSLLETVFVQDDQNGTVLPLGWFEGIMVTRWFVGPDLGHYARTLDAEKALDAYSCAGAWLRRLHDSNPEGYGCQVVDVVDKLDNLGGGYGRLLHGSRGARTSWEVLQHHAVNVGRGPVRSTWSHGDFKPENLLCDGHRYVGLDIHLQFNAPIVFDIASFLDHAWLSSQARASTNGLRDFRLLEQSFLHGYGELGEQEGLALHWAELYFALSYLGRSWQRGPLRSWYASRRLRPLVQILAQQLREVG